MRTIFRWILIGMLAGAPSLAPGAPAAAGSRTWTSTDGRTIKATYLRLDGESLVVRRDGRQDETRISLAMLSDADRQLVRELEAERNKPAPIQGEGIFAGKVTGEWEKLEFGCLQTRLFGAPTLNGNELYPVVLVLHGSGVEGSDNEQQMDCKLGGNIKAFASGPLYEKHPCFIFMPQCPDKSNGWSGKALTDAIGMVKEAVKLLPVDKNRLYVTGASMGGSGTWNALTEEPKLFAAAVPICGGGDPSIARSLKDVPIWVHHGAKDDVADVKYSRDMVAALEKAKGIVKYTEYPTLKHTVWGPCYKNPEVWDWMFAQKRK